MENKKNIIIILLVILIAILSGIIGFVLGSKNSNEMDNQKQKEENKETKYITYQKGQEIKLSDDSAWMVLKDSDENTDYVVLLSKKDYTPSAGSNYDSIDNEIYNKDTQYDNSALKQYVNSLESQIPVKLKEVDGYKIRLITVEEILDFDNNWQYDNIKDSYTYAGEKVNENFLGILTMTHTKCDKGKCTPFYNLSETQCFDGICNKEYFLEHWILGLSGINPVINVSKDSLIK